MPDLNIGMNKKEIRDFVQTVAEIKDLVPIKSPTIRLDDTHQNLVRQGDEWHHLDQTTNHTLGFTLVKLKDQLRSCDIGCGMIIANQVIERRLAFTPQKHWRTRCQTCGKYRAPDGESLLEGSHLVHNAFLTWFRNKSKD